MPSKITISTKHFPALITLVRFMICMREQMCFEVGSLVETTLAHRALVRTLLHVEDLVDGEGSRLTEPFTTLTALEGLLLRVDISVIPQMVLASEGFSTDITGVGSLVSVRPLVDKQVVGFGKLTITEFTDKRFPRPGGA